VADGWVVNASPLIALAHAGKLELLDKLPSELVVPEAVVEEILAGPDDPGRAVARVRLAHIVRVDKLSI